MLCCILKYFWGYKITSLYCNHLQYRTEILPQAILYFKLHDHNDTLIDTCVDQQAIGALNNPCAWDHQVIRTTKDSDGLKYIIPFTVSIYHIIGWKPAHLRAVDKAPSIVTPANGALLKNRTLWFCRFCWIKNILAVSPFLSLLCFYISYTPIFCALITQFHKDLFIHVLPQYKPFHINGCLQREELLNENLSQWQSNNSHTPAAVEAPAQCYYHSPTLVTSSALFFKVFQHLWKQSN